MNNSKFGKPDVANLYRRFTRSRAAAAPLPEVDALLALADGQQSDETERLLADVARSGIAQHREALAHERADHRLELLHLPRREASGHEPPDLGVVGRVEHHDRQRGLGEADLLDLAVVERQPAGRGERRGVARGRGDVGEAREDPVVPGLDVVERLTVAQRGVAGPRRAPSLRRRRDPCGPLRHLGRHVGSMRQKHPICLTPSWDISRCQ